MPVGDEPVLGVKVDIVRYVEDGCPGWVEFILTDALGAVHAFVDKEPMVTEAHLHAGTDYPQPGVIACIVIKRRQGDDGREVVHIDTGRPWGVESTEGTTHFEVFAEQLCEAKGSADA